MSKDKIEDAIYTRRYIYNFHYHLIWVTKYRNPTFTSEWNERNPYNGCGR